MAQWKETGKMTSDYNANLHISMMKSESTEGTVEAQQRST